MYAMNPDAELNEVHRTVCGVAEFLPEESSYMSLPTMT
jgi:hypothetical protein